MHSGTRSPVSVSDEKVQANQDRFCFKHSYLFITTKNSLFTSDIHYFWNGIDFESVILSKCLYIFTRNSLPKKFESRFFTKWIGLNDFKKVQLVTHIPERV